MMLVCLKRIFTFFRKKQREYIYSLYNKRIINIYNTNFNKNALLCYQPASFLLPRWFYWLKNEDPTIGDLIEAEIIDQVINIKNSRSSSLIIQLNDDFIDLNKKVVVNYQHIELFNGFVSRNIKVIERSLKEYGDPYGIYYGEIHLSLAK